MTTKIDILDLMVSLRADRKKLEDSIRTRLDELDRDIEAAQRIINLIPGHVGGEQPTNGVSPLTLAGLSQFDALVEIAAHNDGVLAVKDAKRLLTEAGLTKSKYISQGIYSMMKRRSDKFEYLAEGRFKLKEKNIAFFRKEPT